MTTNVQSEFLSYLRAEENVKSENEAAERLREQLRITRAFMRLACGQNWMSQAESGCQHRGKHADSG